MCIWNKILLGLIGIAAAAFFYLAAWTLQIHRHWAERARQNEQTVERLQKENSLLADNDVGEDKSSQAGIRQVRLELHKLLLDRRRAWFRCDATAKVDRDEGRAEVTVTIDKPAPHGIAKQTVLYAFEDTDVQHKGCYLGEFTVTKVGGKQVTLAPVDILTPREAKRLSTAKRTWTLYEIMPKDNHNIFAGLSDEQKKAMLPAESVKEFLKDGAPAAADDPKERVVGGKYVRALRDYNVLFADEREKRILLSDSIEAATRDKALVVEAVAQAQTQEETCKKEIASVLNELKKAIRDRDVVADYCKKLGDRVAIMRAAVNRLLEENKARVGLIAKFQLEAARRIDAPTHAMAKSGTETR